MKEMKLVSSIPCDVCGKDVLLKIKVPEGYTTTCIFCEAKKNGCVAIPITKR